MRALSLSKERFVPFTVNKDIASIVPLYRPDIEYKWVTAQDQATGSRSIINAGESSPAYSATMYSGRGVKFNGVDKATPIPVTSGQILYKYNIDIKQTLKEHINFTGTYYLGKVGGAGDYETATYNNVIVSNKDFTTTEIQYLHSNPEKFLYHEKQSDGTFIAKSEILSQEKIDNVVAHFPMCETDKFVRDMIGYSESPFNTNTGENGFVDTSEFHTVVSEFSIVDESIRVTDNADNTNSPRIVTNNQLKLNTTYRVTYSIIIDESVQTINYVQFRYGTDYNNNGGYTAIIGGKEISNSDIVFTTTSDENQYCGITVSYAGDNDANGAFFDVHLFKVQELTSTYPIENYTASCNATNLSTGLQTCFWKRDMLGVPVGVPNNGIILPKDLPTSIIRTGYILDDSNSFGIEAILEVFSPRRYGYFNMYPFYFITHVSVDIYLRLNDVSLGTATGVGKHHCYMEYDAVASNIIIAVNGIVMKTGTVTKYGEYGQLADAYRNNGELPLLNVYTEPQDPAKLYADAVRRGIIPEKLEVH